MILIKFQQLILSFEGVIVFYLCDCLGNPRCDCLVFYLMYFLFYPLSTPDSHQDSTFSNLKPLNINSYSRTHQKIYLRVEFLKILHHKSWSATDHCPSATLMIKTLNIPNILNQSSSIPFIYFHEG